MERLRFESYVEWLVDGLRDDPRVLGVVGLGSTALNGRNPDRWSDHDLWVVVADGFEETFRADPSWLPDAGRIVLWLPETGNGMKALYDDGHLVEASVLGPDEVGRGIADEYQVLLDRERIDERMAEAGATRASPGADERRDHGAHLAGRFLTDLLIGVGRYARGEHLSAYEFVQTRGVDHLLRLILRSLSPERAVDGDDLDPRRRVETAYPATAGRIEQAMRLPLPEMALALLEIAERKVEPRLPDYPSRAARVVSSSVREALAAGEWTEAWASRGHRSR